MSAHAVLAPSSAFRRRGCPGSALLELMCPGEDTEQSLEGTAAHELAEEFTRLATRGLGPTPAGEVIGKAASNGVVWTQESYDGAALFASVTRELMQKTGVFGGPGLGIEKRVHAEQIHPECWGTLDFSLYGEEFEQPVLYVLDYKFGHRIVEARENWQLMEYVAGLMHELNIDGLQDQFLTVKMGVVQPRAHHRDGTVRWWTVTASDLRGYFNEARMFEAAALAPDAPTKSGSHCLDCSARAGCPTLQRAGSAAVQFIGDQSLNPLGLPELALQIRLLRWAQEQVKAQLGGLESQAEAHIAAGEVVPSFALAPGRGALDWNAPDAEIIDTLALLGVDIAHPPKAKTPTQAKSLGVDESVIKAYSVHTPGAPKLVDADKTTAYAVFAKKKEA